MNAYEFPRGWNLGEKMPKGHIEEPQFFEVHFRRSGNSIVIRNRSGPAEAGYSMAELFISVWKKPKSRAAANNAPNARRRAEKWLRGVPAAESPG
jgi:hypothetical protein